LSSYDPSWVDDSEGVKASYIVDGVWVVRKPLLGSIISIHPSEIAALRAANAGDTGKAEFIPWEKTLVNTDELTDRGARRDA
jgi:hypothetical protein